MGASINHMDEHTRLALLEAGQHAMQDDMREIKDEMKGLRRDFNSRGQGMSRAEKIAFGGLATTIGMAVIAVIALVQAAPG